MSRVLVPEGFEIPKPFVHSRFRLEPLGPEHNDRDYDAWTSSVAHIRATPGFENADWPASMTLEENLADLVGHAEDFADRRGFTFSIVDKEDVIGCLYIYPSEEPAYDASVKSWVRESRSDMDVIVWESISHWLAKRWPFENPLYAERTSG